MLKFSKQTGYAIEFLIALRALKKGELLSLCQFSKDSKISFLFLQRIARGLKKAGIIESVKGSCGGYFLNKKPEQVSLKDVVEAVDGPCGITDCLMKNGSGCARKKKCKAKNILAKVNKKFCDCVEEFKLSNF